ncbi:hypothetical protein CYMTET_10462 [Cymbomonas tetramitiformis]|uniref:Uncharacterized protein n=1 Tax=Cymbomonas tetramitiformis TaxID=36881 RepID=A0AAE0GP79_9CHLO|nr:hypothetical protein CYMTET_10462 [Cymbomonas tetramitiformis]
MWKPQRDKEVLGLLAKNYAVSAFDKQLRLEQVTSWSSKRHSKQVNASYNARVNSVADAALRNISGAAETESAGTPALNTDGSGMTPSQDGAVTGTSRDGVEAGKSLGKRAAAASAKRVALTALEVVALEQVKACVNDQSRDTVVGKFKVDSLQGLRLVLNNDESYSVPVARKDAHLQAVRILLASIPFLTCGDRDEPEATEPGAIEEVGSIEHAQLLGDGARSGKCH